MAISVAQALPNAELVVVTTPQPSASDIAVRSGLVALQVPMKVRGVVENMSYYEHKGEKLEIFGAGGGQRVSEQLSAALGYDVPLMAQLPLEPEVREIGEAGRPAVLVSMAPCARMALARPSEGWLNGCWQCEPAQPHTFVGGWRLSPARCWWANRLTTAPATWWSRQWSALPAWIGCINLQAIHMDEDAVPRCLGMNGGSTSSPMSGGHLAVNSGIAHYRCDAKR